MTEIALIGAIIILNKNWEGQRDQVSAYSICIRIQTAAAIAEVAAFARQFALDPVAVVVGLIARFESSRNRSATRLAKAIFGDIASARLNHIAQILCLA